MRPANPRAAAHRTLLQKYEHTRSTGWPPIRNLQLRVHDLGLRKRDVDQAIRFLEGFTLNPPNAWLEADLGLKQWIQDFVFPDGLAFDGEQLSTNVTSCVFRTLRRFEGGESGLVAPTGFEPVYQA